MRRPIVLALALAVAPAALAAEASRPGGAEVRFTASTTVVDVGGIEHELDASRFSLDYAEEATDWLSLGFTVAFSFDGMPSQALVAATDPSGYAIGVFAAVQPYARGPFAVNLEVRHLRDYTKGSDGSSDSQMDFDETTFSGGLSWRFDAVELEAGAYTLKLDGEITSTGVVAGTADFEAAESSGTFAAVRLPLARGYALGLFAESGARETLAFTFSTRF